MSASRKKKTLKESSLVSTARGEGPRSLRLVEEGHFGMPLSPLPPRGHLFEANNLPPPRRPPFPGPLPPPRRPAFPGPLPPPRRGPFELGAGENVNEPSEAAEKKRGDRLGPMWPYSLGTGYVPDRADLRDLTLEQLRADRATEKSLGFPPDPLEKRLSVWLDVGSILGPAIHQGPVQCATAHVVTSMARCRIRATGDRSDPLSVLYLYNLTRDLRGSPENRGVTFRETLKAFQKYGCLEESRWPYASDWVDVAPRISDLKLAKPYSGMAFCRLDGPNATGKDTILTLLEALAAGHPIGFGLSILKCFEGMDERAIIPFPENETDARLLAAQSVMATGYQVTDLTDPDNPQGYLRIRNTWGRDWGDAGEAWLPFDYVEHQLAMDFWMIHGGIVEKT